MARLPRLSLGGHVHHILQTGNNRQPIFLDDADYLCMHALFARYAPEFKVAVHAYVLMSNHFHVLVSPESSQGVAGFMQAVGRRYVRYFNDRHGRTGTLWEGRYRSTVIQADVYLLPCMAYIDLNPVRAGLVAHAKDYRWSSFGHYAGLHVDKAVVPHDCYWRLGNTPFAREAAYTDLVQRGIAAQHQVALTEAVRQGWALGDAKFTGHLQKQIPRRVVKAKPGRPRTSESPGGVKEVND